MTLLRGTMENKILFIHQQYYPDMAGTARRTRELAEGLSRRGFDCSVLTSFPREYRSVPGYKALSKETINGVKVRRINTYIEVKKNVIFRLMSYSLFVLIGIFWLIKHRRSFNLIISVAPLNSGIPGAFANKWLKMTHHFDVPDILPDLGIAAGMLQNKLLIKLFFGIEKWVYDHSSSISAPTQGQADNIINKGVNPSKVSLIPDWVDVNFFKVNRSIYYDEIKAKIKPDESQKIISFVGNIGALQGIETFLGLVKQFNREGRWNFKFLFVGDGIMLPILKEEVKNQKIDNVEFIGRVHREHVPAYMAVSDVLVANYVNSSYMEICIPGKTYEYIISQRPIVIGAKGEAANLVNRFNAGIAVSPSNIGEFKGAITEIFKNQKHFKYDTENFAATYNLDSVLKTYEELLNRYFKKS